MIHRLMKNRFHDARTEHIWFTVYADLITTLALVFLALYGLTIMGDAALMEAIQSMKIPDMEAMDFKDLPDLTKVHDELKTEFKSTPEVSVFEEAGSVRIEFGEDVLFASGRAEPKPESRPLLLSVARILNAAPSTIVVEGHTDNQPVRSSSRYKNNEELAMARAMSIVRLFIQEGQIAPAHIAAAAYGAYRPRSSNLTTAGRRMNRRVEIVLLKDFPYEPAKTPSPQGSLHE